MDRPGDASHERERLPGRFCVGWLEMDKPMSHDESFEVGDHIRVVGGPYVGLPGQLVEKPGIRPKALVLISVFGRETHIDVGLWQLEKVEE
jgi:transcription antitermination factor NusG